MKEILRLKGMLEEADIPFEEEARGDFDEIEHIAYPNNIAGERVCSIIQSPYSYGNEDNRLEIMGLLTESERELDDVVGWLTAEEVFCRIIRHHIHISAK